MLSADYVTRSISLIREFAADESTGPRKPPAGSLAALEPEVALLACQAGILNWTLRNLPGTHLEVRNGSLVAAR